MEDLTASFGASLRYLSQRYSMPYDELKGLLTDIGTEELGHLEMVGAIVHQLTRTLTEEQMKEQGLRPPILSIIRRASIRRQPPARRGLLQPWRSPATLWQIWSRIWRQSRRRGATATTFSGSADDPDVNDVIRFLREREIVHFQRFGEAVQLLREKLDEKNVYYMNPALLS